MGVLSQIFGSSDVIDKGLELVDKSFYTEEEIANDKQKLLELKSKTKVELLTAYKPFKLTQRIIALIFSIIFIFIMLNGVLGSLYGIIPMNNVNEALNFANKMYLGEIMLTIIAFYFSGGFIESFNNRSKTK